MVQNRQLQWKTNRKSYVAYQMATKSVTLKVSLTVSSIYIFQYSGSIAFINYNVFKQKLVNVCGLYVVSGVHYCFSE